MKTARFADVVAKCGEPEAHLILLDPAKDRDLQAAIKSKRVMTVFQQTVGTKTDRGIVGFEPGAARQFLIFPKSLRDYAGRTIIGIKYDLLSTKEPAIADRAVLKPAKPRKPPKPAQKEPDNVIVLPRMNSPKPTQKETPAPKKADKATETLKTESKLASKKEKKKPTPKPSKGEASAKSNRVPEADMVEIKAKIREAMAALEDGKQVAAFNLLKRIVEE